MPPLTFLCAHKARGRHEPPLRGEANLSHRWGPIANMFPGPGRLFPCDLSPGAWGQRGPVEARGEGGQTSFPRKCSQRQTSAGQPRSGHCCHDGAVWAGNLPPPAPALRSGPLYPVTRVPPGKGASVPVSLRALWHRFPAGWAERLAGPWGQDDADFLLQSDLIEFHSSRVQTCLEFSGMTLLFFELRQCTEITADSRVPHKKSEF